MRLPAPARYDTAGDGPDGKQKCRSAAGTNTYEGVNPVLSSLPRGLMSFVPKRLVMLSEEQHELLRAAAYLQGCRTGKLLRDMLSEALETLREDEDVQRLARISRLERSGLRAV